MKKLKWDDDEIRNTLWIPYLGHVEVFPKYLPQRTCRGCRGGCNQTREEETPTVLLVSQNDLNVLISVIIPLNFLDHHKLDLCRKHISTLCAGRLKGLLLLFRLVVSGFFLTRSRSFCFSLNHHRSSFVCKCVLICSSLMPTARKQHPSLFLFNKCVVKAEWFYAGAFLLLHFCSVPWRALVNGKIKQRAHAAVDVRVWVSLDWFFRSALNNLVYSGMKGHRGSFVDAEVHDWFLIYCPPSILFSLSHSFSMLFSSSKYSLHLLNTLHLFPRLSSTTRTCCTCYITDNR